MIGAVIAFEVIGAIFLFYAVDGLFDELRSDVRLICALRWCGQPWRREALAELITVIMLSVFWFGFLFWAIAKGRTRWQKK